MRDQVEETIQAIRPAIQADNGDIMLIDVAEDTGVVTVELIGACVSCPASTVTLKAGIERILKDRVPGVTEVINAARPSTPSARPPSRSRAEARSLRAGEREPAAPGAGGEPIHEWLEVRPFLAAPPNFTH